VLLLIGLLLLTWALLAAAPPARAATGSSVLGEFLFAPLGGPVGDTHTWDGEAGWDDQKWSNPVNWVDDSLPSNGDDLVFPDGYTAFNDDLLTSVGTVDLGMGTGAHGSAVTVGELLYGRGYDDWGSSWGCPTTLRDDTTISTIPSSNPTGAPFAIGTVSLEDSSGVGHTLTVDPVDWNRVSMEGGLTGKGALVKKGSGVLLLGGYWPESGFTWDGPTDVQAGTLWIVSTGALSSHTDVHIAADATVKATIWDSTEPGRDTWGNTFTGDGTLDLSAGYLTFTAASGSFTGTALCGSEASLTQIGSFPARTEVVGTLRGTGTVGPLTLALLVRYWGGYSAGSVSPAIEDFESGMLTVSGAGSFEPGSSYACDVSDVSGAAGTGNDQLAVDGDMTFAGAAETPVAVVLRSGAGGGEGPAAGFSRAGSYRWSVLRTGGSIAGFTEATVSLDTSPFVAQNPNATGTFDLEVVDHATYQTLDVTYAPPAVVTLGWTGGGIGGNWSDPGNWDLGRVPQDGDSLRFTGDSNVDTVNDLAGLTLEDVEFSSSSVFSVSGNPVTLTGGVSLPDDRATVDWNADIVLSAGTHLFSTLSQELRVAGGISGGSEAQSTLVVGGQGSVRLSGANSFAGDVRVAGQLNVRSGDGLPGTAAVTVQGAGTLSFTNDSSDPWTVANALSGPEGSRIEVQSGAVTLTGDCSGFLGRTWTQTTTTPRLTVAGGVVLNGIVECHGVIAGTGQLDDLDASGTPWLMPPFFSVMLPCFVSPGDAEYAVGTLTAAGTATIGGGATLDVDVSDSGGGLAHDVLAANEVHVTADPGASPAGRVTVVLRSSDGGKAASLENFDPTQQYQWPIVTAGTSLTVDHPECFTVDVTQFNDGSVTGTFSVEQPDGSNALYVMYDPGPVLSWTGGGDGEDWSDPANWNPARVPQDGDSLRFDSWTVAETRNSIAGLTLANVVFDNGGFSVRGEAVTLTGQMTCGGYATENVWLSAITAPNGHRLLVRGVGRLVLSGGLSGGVDGGAGLTKWGTGELSLSGEAQYVGDLGIQAGTLTATAAQAVPGAAAAQVAADATFDCDFTTRGSATLGGTLTGPAGASLHVGRYTTLTLDGDGSGYLGNATVDGVGLNVGVLHVAEGALFGGTPSGTGAIAGSGTIDGFGDIGYVFPGIHGWRQIGALWYPELTPTTLHAGGSVTWSEGQALAVTIEDAAGEPGTGYDQVVVDGSVTVDEDATTVVGLVGDHDGTVGECTGFDPTKAGRWHVLRATGAISGFEPASSAVDTTWFLNDLQDGSFGLELGTQDVDGETYQTLDLVFTPAEFVGPVAGFGNALACGRGYLNAPNSDAVAFSGASEATVEMWVRPHGGATDNTTLMRQRDGGAGTEEIWFAITKDQMLFGGVQNYAEPGWLFFGFDHQLPLEKWSHVAMVKTTTQIQLFINGDLVDAQDYGAPFNEGAPSKAPLTFGGDYLEGNHVPGDLDEIMVYDRALSEEQLAAVYNRGPGQGLAAGVADPVRYYRLDETEGTAAADAGSDGVDAALVDMGAAPWIASTAGREAEGRHSTPGVVALAYGSFGAADLTVDVEQQPEHGTVDLTAAALGQGTYTPSAGWAGTETFTYTVSDGTTTTDPLTAWVTAPAPDTHTWDSGGTTALWSEAANWVGDTVPTDGDSLVFPDGTLYDPVNDLKAGLTLHDITLARPGMAVLGNAITLTGALVRTVADEAHIDWHPDLQLGDEATLGSTAGILNLKEAAVSGGDLTKTGAGTVSLRDASSYTGKTAVEGGTLHFNADGALPAGSAVSIAAGATVDVDPMEKATTAYDNVFSGPEGATLRFSYGTPMLTGDSSGFAGATEAETSVIVTGSLGGTISGKSAVSGSGTVGVMDGVMVLPSMRGEETFAISTLTGSYWTGEAAGFGITDAAGDPGVGYDQLWITGDVDIPAVVDGKGGLMVVPMSIDGTGASGSCANFDPATSYRWLVVHVDGQVNGFDPAAASVFADAFVNDLAGGTFGFELTDHETYRTLDLVFTPVGDTHTWDGEAGTEHPEWSNALNWVGDTVPGNGDSLVFPAGSGYNATNDDLLDDVGAISVGHELFVDGSALGLGADLTLGRDSVWAVTTTTLEDDVSVVSTVTPEPTPESTPYAHLGQDIGMLSPTSGAHALTVENYFGYIVHHGSLAGADAACSLTKKGAGTFVLGGPGGKGNPWSGTNTWAGPTDVQAGTLGIDAPGALSSHTDVHVEGGARVAISFPDAAATDVWSNEFTGSGRIDVESAALTMTAASTEFFGTVDISSGAALTTTGSWPADTVVGGLLRGTGTVGFLTAESGGALSPAVDDYESNTLDGGGMALLKGGSSYVCDVTDAEAAAGLGHDLLALQGDVTFSDTSTDAVTVVLRSGAGGTEGPAPHFDKTTSYRWTILTTPTRINGFDANAVTLDTSAFEAQNPVSGGTFALEVADHTTSQSLDIVYAPGARTVVWDGGGTSEKWSNAANWVGDVAPRDGDTLRFSGSTRPMNTNDLLTSVGGIEFTDGGFVLGGLGLMLTGPVTSTATGTQCIVQLPVTLAADVSATTASADLSLLFVHLNDGVAGHALTAGGAGTVYLGSIDGAGVASTLTKTGAGKLYLISANTFGGAVTVSEGTLATVVDGALPSGAAVAVASGATLACATVVDDLQTWDNPITGPVGAAIELVEQRNLSLTGDSSGFEGTTTVGFKSTLFVDGKLGGALAGAEGVVAGSGTLGSVSGPTVWPGLLSLEGGGCQVTTLTAGAVTLAPGSGMMVDMRDAAGAAGAGFDRVEVTGTVDVTATAGSPCGVAPFTITADGKLGDCSNFDRTTDQSWPILHATGGITDFAADKFTVMTDFFSNAIGEGTFSVALSDDAKTLNLVFTAGHPLSIWDGGAGLGHPEWSNALNWVGDVAPVNNADLSFPSTPVTAHNDAFLTRVHDVTIGAAAGVDGSTLTLGGTLALTTHSSYGISATTLAADTTVLYAAAGYTNPATIAGDVQMVDASSVGHALTFDVRNGGSILTTGHILGTKAACTLTMTGNGLLELGNGAAWSGDNTWSGDTSITSGWITVRRPGALSSLSGRVHVAADAGVDYELNAATPHAVSDATWTGSGNLRALYASDLQLTADSSGFTGTLDGMFGGQIGVLDKAGGNAWTHNGGGFYGHGTLGSLNMGWQGTLSPGDAAYKVATLSGAGDAVLGWGTYTVDVKDATGEAGAGYDTFAAAGSHGIYVNDFADEGRMLTIALRSSDGSAAAEAVNFDPAKTCRWHIASATNGVINWFDRAVYTIDAAAFTNDLDGGSFALGLSNSGKSLDVVFTPRPSATFTWDGGGADDNWSTAANWVGDKAPRDGDSLVFTGATRQTPVNDTLTTIGSVAVTTTGFDVKGAALSITGGMSSDVGTGTTTWEIPLTLGANIQVTSTLGGHFTFTGAVSLGEGEDAKILTTDGAGQIEFDGALSGGSAATYGIIKMSTGPLVLKADNTWQGKLYITGGSVSAYKPGSLPAGVPVEFVGGGEVAAYLGAGVSGTWDNAFTGPGTINVHTGSLTLTGDSSAYTGLSYDRSELTVNGKLAGALGAYGPLRGEGRVGGTAVEGQGRVNIINGGVLQPGAADYDVGTLETRGWTYLAGRTGGDSGSYVVDVCDASGSAGTGYDRLQAVGLGNVTVDAVPAPFVIKLRSSDGTKSADTANFDNSKTYRWHVADQESGTVQGFAAGRVTVDASAFTNALAGGTFGVELSADSKSLDVVFTPCADFTTGPTVGDGGSEFAKTSKQTVAWEMDAAPPAGGVFKVVADDPDSATNVLLGTVDASSETKYSYDWTIAQGPSTGWHVTVQLWSGSGDSAVQYRTKDSQSFDIVPAEYTIKPSVVGTPAHGTISPATDQTVAYKATPKFAFQPETGYHVKEVKVDGSLVTMTGENEYTFPAVKADHTISVEFAVDTFTITPSVVGATPHGSITPDTSQTVDYGATPKFAFDADDDYHVKTVRVDGESVTMTGTDEYTFPAVTKGHTISVEFAIDTFTITPSVVGATPHGSITPDTAQTVDYGATPKFTFAPAEHYHVKTVRVDGDPVTLTGTDEYTFPAVTKSHTISVEFAIDTFAITVTPGAHGGITPGTGTVEYGSSPEYTITADEGYHIADVVADAKSLGAVGSVTFKDVAETHTLSATFAIDRFNITPSVVGGSGGHGSITPSEPQSVDWHGTPLFTFAPDTGYEVAEVLVDGTAVTMTGTNEYQFPAVTAGHTISVAFAVNTLTISVTSGEHGSVTPGTGEVEYGGTPTYAITPDEGFRVAEVLVDGSSVGAVTSYQFAAVQVDHTLAASFVPLGMPSTTVSGASGRWSRTPVTLTFTGHPGEAGVPIAFTEYKAGEGEWAEGATVTIRGQGETRVWYRSVDETGAVQDPPGSCLVRIDTRRPKVVARSLRARPSQTARLRYKVKDPLPTSGSALVRCVVRNAKGKVMTRSSAVPVGVNTWLRLRVSTWAIHAPGAYTVELRAKDRAGNWQKGWTSVRLTIR
jgi:autotransporter-associated beta strand protein